MLREPVVLGRVGERSAGEQVVLVGREHEPAPEHVEEPGLPAPDGVEHGAGLAAVCGRISGSVGVVAHPQRHDADRRQSGEQVEHAEQCVVEHGAVVEAGAHDDLTVHLDAGVEQRAEPPEAGGAAAVAEQARPQVGIGGVDAHVERAEPSR